MGVLRTSALRLNVGEAQQANDRPQPLHFLPVRFGPRHFPVRHFQSPTPRCQHRLCRNASSRMGRVPRQQSDRLHNRFVRLLRRAANSFARAVVKAPKSSHITPILKSLRWLKVNESIEYKLISLTYKVLTSSQPSCLNNLISVQPPRSTRSLAVVTLSRPPTISS